MKTKTVHVLRAFIYRGTTHAIGSEVVLPASFATDMISAGKARIVSEVEADLETIIPSVHIENESEEVTQEDNRKRGGKRYVK